MLIDALTHVTSDGKWFSTEHDARVSTLLRQMDSAGVARAAVVGLPGYISNHDVERACAAHRDRFLPVGSFDPTPQTNDTLAARVRELHDLGLAGVKLHPRLSRFDPLDASVLEFLDQLGQLQDPPVVWLCSFLYYPGGSLRKPPVETFYELVGRYPEQRFILAHGGGPDFLRVAHAIRSNRNVLLDLSFTQTRFAGSSVDLDIRSLFETFGQRLVFGSDFPEVSLSRALADFERLSAGIDEETRKQVLGGNFRRFLGLSDEGS